MVSSSNVVRFVQAGIDKVADGTDDVRTIYGKAPRDDFPETVTRCLEAATFMPAPDGTAPPIVAVDGCLSIVTVLRPQLSDLP